MLQTAFVLGRVLLAFCVGPCLGACSYLDESERRPSAASGLPGVLVETSLTDAQIQELNAKVIHRFKSVPRLVMVDSVSSEIMSKSTSFSVSKDFSETTKRFNKSVFLSPLSAPSLTWDVPAGEGGSPWYEGGFARAQSIINSRTLSLAPVEVAIIDSGVVPATHSLKRALVSVLNLSNDPDTCGWSDHGTGVASIFVGIQVERGVSPCERPGTGVSVGSLYQQALAPNARLHSIKISFEGDRVASMRGDLGGLQLAAALDEAVAVGAKVVNLSFSYTGTLPDPLALRAEMYVMAKAAERGVVFVAAVGNAGNYLSNAGVFPAGYRIDNLVVVGSHTSGLQRATDSNFGPVVDITAQGAAVRANDKWGRVSVFSGTSFAAPEVAAAIALYMGALPRYEHHELLKDLFTSAVPSYAYDPLTGSRTISRYGRLDAAGLLENGLKRTTLNLR